MEQYVVSVYIRDDFDPSTMDAALFRDIEALNEEMKAARVRIFVGGHAPVKSAKSLRVEGGGPVVVTDGPYTETKEHVGGFWVLAVENQDEALAWGRKVAVTCRGSVEVRQVFQRVEIDWPRI